VIRAHDVHPGTHPDKDPGCLSINSAGAWFGHKYNILTSNTFFGDLGTFLDRVEAKGGEVVMCTTGGRSDLDHYRAPELPLWHEIGHYLLFQMYNPYIANRTESNLPHAGYHVNNNTNDAIIEGFAGFVTILIDEHYNDPYNDASPPYVYNTENVELDIMIWGSGQLDEENALAGILWDFYDRGLEINRGYFRNPAATTSSGSYIGATLTPVSKVYPQSEDQISLSAPVIMAVIERNDVSTLVDLYNAFISERRIGSIDMDMIYVNHGVYADVVERNYIHDSAAEKIGESGSIDAPARPVRFTPPEVQGSYIVSDAPATFNITINFVDELSNYDYSYLREAKPGEKMYFTMPPEYYPSTATIASIAADGSTLDSEVVTIRSDEYWNYINSNPPQDAVFRQISIKSDSTSDTTSTLQYIQKIKAQLNMVSAEYGASNATGAEEVAIAAYKDYFEHLKAELEHRNATELSEQTDQMLRVELVELIREGADQQSVDDKIASINLKLDEAIVIVPEFPISAVGVMAALIGALGLIGRTRFFRK
jgi:hypothetical protein